MTHNCPICTEDCDCQDMDVWGECSHCVKQAKERNGSDESSKEAQS